MPRRGRPPAERAQTEDAMTADQVVAYNFKLARTLRDWTQDETAQNLAQHLGQELPKASISAIERSADGDRRREFTAQELVAFALTFDVPIAWFFMPPGDQRSHRRLAGTDHNVFELIRLLFGTEEQLRVLPDRLAQLHEDERAQVTEAVEEMLSLPKGLTWEHVNQVRKEALFAVFDKEADNFEGRVAALKGVLDEFEALSIRLYMQSSLPTRAYTSVAQSLLGKKIFERVLPASNPKAPGQPRYPGLKTLATDDGVAWEELIDLEDEETLEHLRAVFDRAEQRAKQPRTRNRARSAKK